MKEGIVDIHLKHSKDLSDDQKNEVFDLLTKLQRDTENKKILWETDNERDIFRAKSKENESGFIYSLVGHHLDTITDQYEHTYCFEIVGRQIFHCSETEAGSHEKFKELEKSIKESLSRFPKNRSLKEITDSFDD